MRSPAVTPPPQRQTERGLVVFLGVLVGFGPASVDMYLPSLPAIRAGLATTPEVVQLTLSAFFFGYSIGQLIIGPLSDRFGRMPVLVGGAILFAASSLLCAITPNVEILIGLRLLQAIGGSAGIVTARAIARDVYSGPAMARAISVMMVVAAAASLVTPFLGTYLTLVAGWRSIFVALTVFGLAVAIVGPRLFRETLPDGARVTFSLASSIRSYRAILRDRDGAGYLLAGGASFGTLFAYVGGISFVYIEHFGVTPQLFPWLFGLNVLGLAGGSILNARLVGRYSSDRLLKIGTVLNALGALVLLFLGWTGIGGLPAFALALFATVGPLHMVNSNANAGLLEHYPHVAATASALFGAIQFAFGAIASVAVGLFFSGGPESMVSVIAACSVFCFAARKILVKR